MELFEYNLDDESTWTVREAPAQADGFNDGLIEIAGYNPFGGQMLRTVWGGTHHAKGILVYKLCDTDETCIGYQYRDPDSGEMVETPYGTLASIPLTAIPITIYGRLELGELRWMVERWRSPEQLAHMGYFDESLAHVVTEVPVDARFAKREIKARIRAGEKPEVAICRVEGEIDRQRPMVTDQTIKTFFDPEWRQQGDYELFLKLERKNGLYHDADAEALIGIAAMWDYNENTPLSKQIEDEKAASVARRKEVQRRIQELWEADPVPVNPERVYSLPAQAPEVALPTYERTASITNLDKL